MAKSRSTGSTGQRRRSSGSRAGVPQTRKAGSTSAPKSTAAIGRSRPERLGVARAGGTDRAESLGSGGSSTRGVDGMPKAAVPETGSSPAAEARSVLVAPAKLSGTRRRLIWDQVQKLEESRDLREELGEQVCWPTEMVCINRINRLLDLEIVREYSAPTNPAEKAKLRIRSSLCPRTREGTAAIKQWLFSDGAEDRQKSDGSDESWVAIRDFAEPMQRRIRDAAKPNRKRRRLDKSKRNGVFGVFVQQVLDVFGRELEELLRSKPETLPRAIASALS